MGPQEIALRRRGAIALPAAGSASSDLKAQLQAEAMALGFVFEDDAVCALAGAPGARPVVFEALQRLVGADLAWEPMYPDFPAQVFDASLAELYLNAVLHYHTWGQWRPTYPETPRLPLFEADAHFTPVALIPPDALLDVFAELLGAHGALAAVDRQILTSLLHHFDEPDLAARVPAYIPFKETLCLLVAEALRNEMPTLADGAVRSATDVLRVAAGLSGGDTTLAKPTRFKLNRRHRRWLVAALEPRVDEGELARHPERWKRLLHHLHIGGVEHAPQTRALAHKLRNGRLRRPNAQVEGALAEGDIAAALRELERRPGALARRLDHLLRVAPADQQAAVLEAFDACASRVSTRVLVQMLGHFQTRVGLGARVVFSKAAGARPHLLTTPPPALAPHLVERVAWALRSALLTRFAALPPLGAVWIDPALAKSPVPLQLRDASEGLKVLQRGTHLPLGDKRTLRFFVHWVGMDLDLSAAFLTDDLQHHSEIAYYALKSQGDAAPYRAVHSGDITHAPAPDGACEFIDIDLESVRDPAVRYVAMDVRVYDGPPFPYQSANVGWMMRDALGQEGEVFDARTVQQRIALSAHARSTIVALFDIRERSVVWLDIVGSANGFRGGNNVASNRRDIRTMSAAILRSRLLPLYDLLQLHQQARGTEAESPEEADTRFGAELALDYTRVLADFMG